MTVVNPKSISGINSITTGSGSDNLLTIHTSDASSTERVRINSSGDVIVGSGITVSPDGDIFATGVTTSTTFVGNLTGNVTGNTSGTAGGLTGSPNVTVGDITIGETIFHDGDTDTSVKFPAADTVSINTGGGENARFTTSSNVFKAPDGGNRYFFGGTGNSADAELSLYDASDAQKVRLAANNTSFFSGGGVGLGKNTNADTTDGAFFSSTVSNIVLPSSNYLVFNRNASGAGTLIDFRSQNTSKGGIHFNGTNIAYQSGSNNIFNENGVTFDNGSNYLDDYEVGTWTPLIRNSSGTGTAGVSNYGYYTKVGNVVHAHATVHWTALNSGATSAMVMIVGLPHPSKNASNYRSTTLIGGQVVGVHNGNDDGMNIAIGCDANMSAVYVTAVNGSATGGYNYTHYPTVLTSGTIYGFSFTYLTN